MSRSIIFIKGSASGSTARSKTKSCVLIGIAGMCTMFSGCNESNLNNNWTQHFGNQYVPISVGFEDFAKHVMNDERHVSKIQDILDKQLDSDSIIAMQLLVDALAAMSYPHPNPEYMELADGLLFLQGYSCQHEAMIRRNYPNSMVFDDLVRILLDCDCYPAQRIFAANQLVEWGLDHHQRARLIKLATKKIHDDSKSWELRSLCAYVLSMYGNVPHKVCHDLIREGEEFVKDNEHWKSLQELLVSRCGH